MSCISEFAAQQNSYALSLRRAHCVVSSCRTYVINNVCFYQIQFKQHEEGYFSMYVETMQAL